MLRLRAGQAGAGTDLAAAYRNGARSGALLAGLAQLALAGGDATQALRIAEQGMSLDPPDPDLIKLRAAILLKLARPADAAALLLEYLAWRPSDPQVLRQLLELAKAAGDTAGVQQMQARLAIVSPGAVSR